MNDITIKYHFQNKKDKSINHLFVNAQKDNIFSVGDLTAFFLHHGLSDNRCHFRFKDQLEGAIVWVDIKNEKAIIPTTKYGEVEVKILSVPYVCDQRKIPRKPYRQSEKPVTPSQPLTKNATLDLNGKNPSPNRQKSPQVQAPTEPSKMSYGYNKLAFAPTQEKPLGNVRAPSPKLDQPIRSNLSSQDKPTNNVFGNDIDFLKQSMNRPHSQNVEFTTDHRNHNLHNKDFDIFNDFTTTKMDQKQPTQHTQAQPNKDFDLDFDGFSEPPKQPSSNNLMHQNSVNGQHELFDLDYSQKQTYFADKREDEVKKKEMKMEASNQVDPMIRNWAYKNNVRKDLRTLLCSLHEVMWPGNQLWEVVQLTDILSDAQLKKIALKAIISLHPDKNPQLDPYKLYILECVVAEVNSAYREYKKMA